MRKLIETISFIALLSNSSTAQNQNFTFHIKGDILGRDTGKIILKYINDKEQYIADTTYLIKGKFEFKGRVLHPTFCILKGNKSMVNFHDVNDVSLVIDPGEMHISLIENDYEHAKITGGETQKEYDSLLQQIDVISIKYKALYEADLAAKKAVQKNENNQTLKFADSIRYMLAPAYHKKDNIVISFIASHPDSYVSVYFLGGYSRQFPTDSVEFLF